ncbi:hypothetical protein K469DRAFT_709240 [Zopfia rhizophila CBS 207.26]|uniref:RAD52 homolog n=1 Tax=Zopfia rhizophila CBS 207.26 TaxID=1314779 RepID=A0A6A6E2W0_9PEZI|nr:hypothetical protein K469DRAFT_709240 [Zopfia rhizophila CBS 207.26]
MPRPGDQYHAPHIQNPFEERTIKSFTAQEIATLQSRLNRQLGPEYISTRTGNGGSKVAYLEGNKAIVLANEVFGFNGWSSSLQQVQIDYVDENPQNGRVNIGLSIIVRVTLKDGTYHEDIGYGHIENAKGKAAAFEKAKKEAATDGLKRALRTFGNVLGNCLYDKEYLKKVNTVNADPIKFDAEKLHRHPDFAPPLKKEEPMVKKEAQKDPQKEFTRSNQVLRTNTEQILGSADFEDEFGGNLFDGVEISEHHGDEFTFETISAPEESVPRLLEAPLKAPEQLNGVPPNRHSQGQNAGTNRQPTSRPQSMPALRPQNGTQPLQQPHQQHQGPPRPQVHPPNPPRGPQTLNPQPLNPQQNNTRPDFNRARMPPPTTDVHVPPRPQQQQQNHSANQPPQNQPFRQTPPQALPMNQQNQPGQVKPEVQRNAGPAPAPPTIHRPPVGFVTSRAAELMQNSENPTGGLPPNLPAFNPHTESPLLKEQRTPGIDHTRSMKVTRDEVRAGGPQQPQQQRPMNGGHPHSRPNFVNPQADANRRIGMPIGGASPLANRGAYKPPGMVSGVKRPPLAGVSNKGNDGVVAEGPDAKRTRIEGVENGANGAVNT